MGRPKTSSVRIPTIKRLLDAAEAEFGRRGSAGARLEDIAKAAGITRPSLLHHFPDKEALYAAVVERVFGELAAALLKPAASGAGDERFTGLALSFSDFLSRRPGLAAIILREFLDGTGPGRGALLKGMGPVLGGIETFLTETGGRRLRPGLPMRAAILQTASSILLRAAAGPLRTPLWGRRDATRELAEALFLRGTT